MENRNEYLTEEEKRILNRLSKATGHLRAIKKMVEENRDCSEVLIQLAAVKAAVNNTGKVVLREYLEDLVEEAVENDDPEILKKMQSVIDSFVK